MQACPARNHARNGLDRSTHRQHIAESRYLAENLNSAAKSSLRLPLQARSNKCRQ
jgi:hypothetical protein